MSSVWDFATKRKNPKTKSLEGQCLRCNKIIVCSGNSKTTLKAHLKTHGIDFERSAAGTSNEEPTAEKRTKSIFEFFNRKSLKEIVTDMATDGISIRAITRNNYIRQSISRDGYKLPANERDVMKLIIEDFNEKKAKVVEIIKEKLANGAKFSMCVDECTTIRGRRFFGINIHSSDDKVTIKTGLVRIVGSCSAEDMVVAMKQHLTEFGIDMNKDIVGSTQDGAAVNKKFIRLVDIIGQFCLNHALHLGVCDTLYKKENEIEEHYFDSDESDESDCFDDCLDLLNDDDIEQSEISYHDLLKNSRKLVKFIKNSTVRNNIFLSKVKALTGREIELHLDVKTRWNSIPTMLDSIIKTEMAIRETLFEFNATHILDSIDFIALRNLYDAMEPIKLAVQRLSQEDATLASAEIILEFMFKKLSMINSKISEELYNNLKIRTDERLNKDVMNLLKSLKDPSNTPTKAKLIFAGRLASRLFGFDEETEIDESIQSESENVSLSLNDELNLLLRKEHTTTTTGSDFKWLKSEFTLYKNTGQRTENLQKLFNALLSIKPTLTDVERVFSVCTNFCTKIRSRLSDESLKALVFLKFYYKK